MKNKITKNDITTGICTHLKYISYAHSPDFVIAMTRAYYTETNTAAKNAIKQILLNSKMCAENQRPICQDTGMAQVFLEIGMHAEFADFDLEEAINDGVRQAYTDSENPLRASMVSDSAFGRQNTRDNTPAIIHTTIVAGDEVHITVAAKGCGSENKAKFTVLEPDADVKSWILAQLPLMGAGWCPPGILGVGIGGSSEHAMLMAKQSVLEEVNIQELAAKESRSSIEQFRLELYEEINGLGIGAQGLGGLSTVLDVKIKDYPTHAASKPVALVANCVATRHYHFKVGDTPPEVDISIYPDLDNDLSDNAIRLNINTATTEELQALRVGDNVLLSGTILTARDKAHKRICEMRAKGEELPFSLANQCIYYVGPVNAAADEVIGPAGPTTSTRMDTYTDCILSAGVIAAIGKAERGLEAAKVFTEYGAVYFIAVGGAAYLISKSITRSRVVAFAELGMEAVYEFEIKDMPIVVAIDTKGNNIHQAISH